MRCERCGYSGERWDFQVERSDIVTYSISPDGGITEEDIDYAMNPQVLRFLCPECGKEVDPDEELIERLYREGFDVSEFRRE